MFIFNLEVSGSNPISDNFLFIFIVIIIKVPGSNPTKIFFYVLKIAHFCPLCLEGLMGGQDLMLLLDYESSWATLEFIQQHVENIPITFWLFKYLFDHRLKQAKKLWLKTLKARILTRLPNIILIAHISSQNSPYCKLPITW